MAEKAKITAEKLSKTFFKGNNSVEAVCNIDLEIREKEFIVFVGPSGCGKSTLLNLVAGFEKPTSGKIFLDGKQVERPGPDRGFVFQHSTLFPWRTVKGNIVFGLEIQGKPRKESEKTAKKYIDLVGLSGFEDAYPNSLSGGMKQRAEIARVLAYDPEVLLMDEPFGALDAQTRKVMQKELIKVWERDKKTVLFVTHSVLEAVYLADRIFLMSARPARIKDVMDVDLPRPRDSRDEDFLEVRNRILTLLEEEVTKSLEKASGFEEDL